MKHLFLVLIIVTIGCNQQSVKKLYVQESDISLSLPYITIDDVFFETSTIIRVNQMDKGVGIKYTMDGTEPTPNSPIITDVLQVHESGVFKFRSFRKGMKPSKTMTIEAFATKKINWVGLKSTSPNSNYASGIEVLTNKTKGDYNFKSDEWYGYQDSIIDFSITLEKGETVNGVVVSTLVDQKSWIFSPRKMSVTYTYADGKSDIQYLELPNCNMESNRYMNYLKIQTKPKSPIKIDVSIKTSAIPSWHSGKGNTPWLFIDEILIL